MLLDHFNVKKKEDKIHKRMNIHLYLRSSYENT